MDEAPEDITSLHYDLAGPLLEEFVLEIEPYPRAEGVAYVPPDDPGDKPENPFAALKGLKSGPEINEAGRDAAGGGQSLDPVFRLRSLPEHLSCYPRRLLSPEPAGFGQP